MNWTTIAGALAVLAGCAHVNEMTTTPHDWPTLDGKPPLVIAHGGASGYLPEHTLGAYKLAIDQGADIIEPDLVFTKDGVLVARHDRYLSTTTDVANDPMFADRKRVDAYAAASDGISREDWWVEDFTYEELRILRARQPRDGRPNDYDGKFEIPTFIEILAVVTEKSKAAGRPVGVYPELKHPAFFASIGMDFDAPLLEALAGFDAGPVFIQSFEPEILKRLKGKTNAKLVQLVTLAPEIDSHVLAPNIPLTEIAEYADGVGPEKQILLGSVYFTDRRGYSGYGQDAHELGLFIHPWTFRDDEPSALAEMYLDTHYIVDRSGAELKFNDPFAPETELEIYFRLGVDGVFTDFPDTAVSVRDMIAAEE